MEKQKVEQAYFIRDGEKITFQEFEKQVAELVGCGMRWEKALAAVFVGRYEEAKRKQYELACVGIDANWKGLMLDDVLIQSKMCPGDYYTDLTLENFHNDKNEDSKNMLTLAEKYLNSCGKSGGGIGFWGRPQVGKTHLGIAICHELTNRYSKPHLYFSYTTQVPRLLDLFVSNEEQYLKEMDIWKTCPVLFIDNLFERYPEEDKLRNTELGEQRFNVTLKIIYDLVNTRKKKRLNTIFAGQTLFEDYWALSEAISIRIDKMTKGFQLDYLGYPHYY